MDKLNFDGSCDPNPGGRMGFGWVISWKDKRPQTEGRKEKRPSPSNTNNVAEYTALYEGLLQYIELGGTGPLLICGDSKLVISQVSGKWKVNNENLAQLKSQINALIQRHGIKVDLKWVPRSENSIADGLAMPDNAQVRIKQERTDVLMDNTTKRVLSDPQVSDISPSLRTRIKELNAHPSPGFKDLAGLRTGGMDVFSGIRTEELKVRAGISATALVQKELEGNIQHQSSALRWMLRGLAPDLAIRKVKVDMEIGAKTNASSYGTAKKPDKNKKGS